MGYQKGSVGYGELVEFFYRTHDPTTKDSQGPDRGTRKWRRGDVATWIRSSKQTGRPVRDGRRVDGALLIRFAEYRSAIFYHSPEQKEIAEKVTAEVQEK